MELSSNWMPLISSVSLCGITADKVIRMIIRTYHKLASFETFEERFEYLKLGSVVGKSTFGFDRVFNQQFYCSKEWKDVRRQVILRDNGCDLGIPGFEIFD